MVPLISSRTPRTSPGGQRPCRRTPFWKRRLAAGSSRAPWHRGLHPGASYMVTDLNQPMIDHAASRQPADTRIKWQQADALTLPFDDAAFDLVCCQFGVMFFPDRISGYREARRILKPGGHFLFNVWDRIEENVFADDVTNALVEIFPSDPPRFLARTPHGYHDMALIRSELKEAGFSRVIIETRSEQSRASSPRIPAVAYCQGTVLRNEIEAREAGKLELQPTTSRRRLLANMAVARLLPRFRRTSLRAVA